MSLKKLHRERTDRHARAIDGQSVILGIIITLFILTGCSGGDISSTAPDTTVPTTTTATDASNTIALSLSQTSVSSDSSDSTALTTMVIKDNIPQEGITVNFSTTAGVISSGSETTDSNGEAVITFQANPGNKANQIATVTASSSGISQSVPITISGTYITLSAGKSSLNEGDKTTLDIKVLDASDVGIHGATVSLVADNSHVTLSNTTGTTTNGSLQVMLSGATVGSTDIEVNSLGATKTITIEVVAASTALNITTPSTSPYIIETGTNQAVTVSGVEGTGVTFVTTLGLWDKGKETQTATITGGTASATLTSGAVGTATVQIYETLKPTNSDTTFINVSPPIISASQVAINLSSSSVAPSSDSITNSITVYAKVITAQSEPVAKVPVTFSLSNGTGGGEYVDPPQALTDSSGYATTTFFSGTSSSSGLGVYITATEQGSGNSNSNKESIIIGGTAASITLSESTKVTVINEDTTYELPMAVLVTDSSGAAVKNAVVTLSAWPTHYRLGFTTDDGPAWVPVPDTSTIYAGATMIPNEDIDRDLVRDPGEDVGPCDVLSNCTNLVADKKLTPPSSAAGSVPSSVTTTDNGTASFTLTYLKSSAFWIESEVSASVRVLGTESRASLTFWLGFAENDAKYLRSSPYGYHYNVPGMLE